MMNPDTKHKCQEAMKLIKEDRWQEAHTLVDGLSESSACRIHAYLHRIEGDLWNADYWYKRAGCERPTVSIAEEWTQIMNDLNT